MYHYLMVSFHAPQVMGIINCTPDSFYSGSRCMDGEEAWRRALKMMGEGADIIDVGGESTRPGSGGVDAEEQIRRVIPVIKRMRAETRIPISIDTQSARVAEAALDAGATMINDISALSADPRMADLAADRRTPVVLMHMRGRPANMQDKPFYQDVVGEVKTALKISVDRALGAGIVENQIVLDPGIGFGKRLEDNVALLARLPELRIDNYPLMVGLSRKSFLGALMEREELRLADGAAVLGIPDETHMRRGGNNPRERLPITSLAHAWCLTRGVDMLRVHDVGEIRRLIALWETMSWAS